MNRLLKITVLFWLLMPAISSQAQISVSYYSSSLSKAGVAYNINDRFWIELRVYSNTVFDDITPEMVFCFNMVSKENHNVYLGLGANVNFFTGPVLPVGVQFNPFKEFRRFSLHVELQPSLDIEGEDLILQASWGLRYKFLKE
ncbi:MAG TPA: hypothetical protein VHI78_12350 [Bacteroidales bacterium]|jgi:hypothetical protein|nr:hypothetical protein [Bacteroidales bacterium]